MCAYVCEWVSGWVRACVRTCVHACVSVCVCVRAYVRVGGGVWVGAWTSCGVGGCGCAGVCGEGWVRWTLHTVLSGSLSIVRRVGHGASVGFGTT